MIPKRRVAPGFLGLFFLFGFVLAGCGHLRPKSESETAYVLAKQTFLRDRVAAVSNRVAMVQNGQHLIILERGRRFLKVRTDKGEIGWIEERAVVDPKVVTAFEELSRAHAHDPVVATAVLRDDLYMHVQPGRDTDRYYLLPENDKLQMLVRASVPKADASQQKPKPASTATASLKPTKSDAAAAISKKPGTTGASAKPNTTAAEPAAEPVPLEDWWLVRDSQGRVGWLLARRMDVDVAEEIAGYAEGWKIVGAYVLATVNDPESNVSNKQVPEYVAVLNPYKDGLPYDFSQVRVFTWNLRKHRYETAFRQRDIEGYLPVTISRQTFDNAGPVPTFQFKQSVGEDVGTDAGTTHPAQMETETYRLDGVLVKKVVPVVKAVAAAPTAARATTTSNPVRHMRKRHTAARHRHKH